jgi:hypothetical protein
MVTSPINRDFEVIYSPFEVVQKQKPKTNNQQANNASRWSNIQKFRPLFQTGEFGGGMLGPTLHLRAITSSPPHPSIFPVKTVEDLRR